MNKSVEWNNQKIEPVLITFNRANCLERTLRTFLDAGLESMKLHVLDNASTDGTAEVVQRIQCEWPNLRYHRNRYNIGGNGNILRAVEVSESEYNWVIGDDDAWHLESLEELIAVLEANEADIIRLGWLASEESRGITLDAQELAKNEKLFFASITMISATIARRSLVTTYLAQAYQNTGDAFPQLVPIMRGVEEISLSVYTLSKDVMTHTPSTEAGYYSGDLEFYASWFRSARFLESPTLKAKFVQEIMTYITRDNPGRLRQLALLFKITLTYKAMGISQGHHLLSMLAYGQGWRGRLLLVEFFHFITPFWLAYRLDRIYRYVRRYPDPKISVDRSRL
jgi:glycosyltransferase involved in cell wall biosynthesis